MCQLFLESVRTNLLRDVAARASTCLYESVCHADDWPIGHEPIGHGVADDELTSYTDHKQASNGACYHQNPQISSNIPNADFEITRIQESQNVLTKFPGSSFEWFVIPGCRVLECKGFEARDDPLVGRSDQWISSGRPQPR